MSDKNQEKSIETLVEEKSIETLVEEKSIETLVEEKSIETLVDELTACPVQENDVQENATSLGEENVTLGGELKNPDTPPEERKFKRKVALVIGYNGLSYRGFQLNYEDRLREDGSEKYVEGEVLGALVRANLVLPDNEVNLSRINWSRSSRTDAGVHASKLVVACKILVERGEDEDQILEDCRERLNAELLNKPIRVFSLCRIAPSFNAKKACSWRSYYYYLPKSLLPFEDGLEVLNVSLSRFVGTHNYQNFTNLSNRSVTKDYEHKVSVRKKRRDFKKRKQEQPPPDVASDEDDGESSQVSGIGYQTDVDTANDNLAAPASSTTETDTAETAPKDESIITLDIFGTFGTYLQLKSKEPSVHYINRCYSVIYDCKCEEHDDEFLKITIMGRFFLYNQIRLIIGTAVAIARRSLHPQVLDKTLDQTSISFDLPLAPAEGLVLAEAGFGDSDPRSGKVALDSSQALLADGLYFEEGKTKYYLLMKGGDAEFSDEFLSNEIVSKAIKASWENIGDSHCWSHSEVKMDEQLNMLDLIFKRHCVAKYQPLDYRSFLRTTSETTFNRMKELYASFVKYKTKFLGDKLAIFNHDFKADAIADGTLNPLEKNKRKKRNLMKTDGNYYKLHLLNKQLLDLLLPSRLSTSLACKYFVQMLPGGNRLLNLQLGLISKFCLPNIGQNDEVSTTEKDESRENHKHQILVASIDEILDKIDNDANIDSLELDGFLLNKLISTNCY